MKVRIVNKNGKGHDTEITDAETGEKVGGICAATIYCKNNEYVKAELTFIIPEIDVFAIAKLSDKTKQDMRHLYDVLKAIDNMEKAQEEVV